MQPHSQIPVSQHYQRQRGASVRCRLLSCGPAPPSSARRLPADDTGFDPGPLLASCLPSYRPYRHHFSPATLRSPGTEDNEEETHRQRIAELQREVDRLRTQHQNLLSSVNALNQPETPRRSPQPSRSSTSSAGSQNTLDLHSSHGQYTQVSGMPSSALYDRSTGPPPPPRSPREAPASPHHYPHHLKRRGSLTRLTTQTSNGESSPHHQQRRGSDHSTAGGPTSASNTSSTSSHAGNGSGSGGGTLGRNKGSSSSSGGLMMMDPYELSEELKEHEVVMLERKYSGRAGLMTPHRAARVIQRNFREYVVKKQFEMLRTERRPNRRLEHLQRSTSMLVDADQPQQLPPPLGVSAPVSEITATGGILSRALKQTNSFEDVLLERAYSVCWTSAEPGSTENSSGTSGGVTAGQSGTSSGGGSRDSGVDADGMGQQPHHHSHAQSHAGRRDGAPSHSTSTTSMNSAATEASSGSAASSSSSSSGISSTTAATVVVRGTPVSSSSHHHQWHRQGSTGSGAGVTVPGVVWQQQSGGQGLSESNSSQAVHHHHHQHLHHQQQQSAVGQPGHQCSCHHHHHNHHQHPAHHRANATPATSTPHHVQPMSGHRNYTVGSSTPSPASSHSSVLSRDKYHHRSGVDTPPSVPHAHSVSSERKRKRMYRVGLHIFNKKPDRGLQFMTEKNFVGNSPIDVAQFLFSRKGLSRRMVGEYLGLINNRFAQQVLDHYAEQMDFRGMEVDEALRLFLSHFQMMGESQKVAKILEVFSYYYAKANPDWMCRHMRNWDTLYTLTYGIVMLHTDLHNPSVKSRRMRPDDFVANLRGLDNGVSLDPSMLYGIYQRIKATKFDLMPDHTDMVRNIAENLRSNSSKSSSSEGSGHSSNKESNPGMHLVANLVRSHRRLVCYCRLYEVTEMSKKEKPGAHLREVFLFNDMLLITKPVVKRISKEKVNHYRKHFSLHNVQVYLFESPYYPFGVQIKSSLDGSVLATFHHANEGDRSGFVDDLHESVLELSYVESMRIEGELQQQHRRATAAAIVSPSSLSSSSSSSPRPPPPPVPQSGSSRPSASPQSANTKENNAALAEHDLLSLQAAHEQLQAAGAKQHSHPGANLSSGSGNRYSADSGVVEQEYGSGTRTFYV